MLLFYFVAIKGNSSKKLRDKKGEKMIERIKKRKKRKRKKKKMLSKYFSNLIAKIKCPKIQNMHENTQPHSPPPHAHTHNLKGSQQQHIFKFKCP